MYVVVLFKFRNRYDINGAKMYNYVFMRIEQYYD